jgi:DNA polymerase elongation subunit (family B)
MDMSSLSDKDIIELRKQTVNDISKYHNLQIAKKTQLNGAYGSLANVHNRWFDFNLAEAITMSGQLSVRWIGNKMNEYLNKILKTKDFDYIIASDTDSIYVDMEGLVNKVGITDELQIVKMLDEFCEQKIQPMINKSYEELATYMNAYKQKMFMKRETIASKGIWRGKKMYILNAWNIEGVQFSEPQVKVSGIESVRSSTPKACRASIKKALEIIMNKDEATTQKFIAEFKDNFSTLPFEDIAFPRGVKGLDKYASKVDGDVYIKGTPIHVKGALLYNNLIRNNEELSNKYPLIGENDKIKFAYLRMPNIIEDTVISVPESLPNEFGLLQYVDYDMQFQKTFLDPITSILDVIGWKAEKHLTLEDYM